MFMNVRIAKVLSRRVAQLQYPDLVVMRTRRAVGNHATNTYKQETKVVKKEVIQSSAEKVPVASKRSVKAAEILKLDQLAISKPKAKSVARPHIKIHDVARKNKFGKINPIWKQHFENIRTMRTVRDAPVDTDGCDKLFDPKDTTRNQRFQILLSLLFSSQTKDPINAACLQRFKDAKMANLEACQAASEETLSDMIRGVSFHKTKAKNLKRICDILPTQFDSDIPRTLTGLTSLPGIGFKMGHLIMAAAWGEITGLAVDVHVHRTVNRLKWFRKTIDKPNDMMDALMANIPKEHWRDVNHLIVGFGQQRCFAKKPKCDGCLNQKICTFRG